MRLQNQEKRIQVTSSSEQSVQNFRSFHERGYTYSIYKRILEQTCTKSAVKFIISAHPFCELKMGFDFKNFCLLLLHSNLQMLGLPYLVFPSNPYL